MVNHPNRKRTLFHVHAYPGELLGKFSSEVDAQRVAQMWSARWGSWAEVYDIAKHGGIIIGQYDKGRLTPEFAHVENQITGLNTIVREG